MFLPNTKGMWFSMLSRNRQGEPIFDQPREIECGVVRLSRAAKRTSVRADSSASRGNAEELSMEVAKILFAAGSAIKIGDRFVIAFYDLEVVSREPRLNTSGTLDHIECEFVVFNSDE